MHSKGPIAAHLTVRSLLVACKQIQTTKKNAEKYMAGVSVHLLMRGPFYFFLFVRNGAITLIISGAAVSS